MTNRTSLPLLSPLASSQWLADHLGTDGLVILDATVVAGSSPDGTPSWLSGEDDFRVAGHIPGAVFADLLKDFSDPMGEHSFTKPSVEQFERAASSVGVDNSTAVVVYDSAIGQWAARVWWLFRAFGFDNVAVLDGGLTAWKAQSRPLEKGPVSPRRATFIASARPELWVDKRDVESIVTGTTTAALVCGTSSREFSGEVGQHSRLGHIPGSVSVPAGQLVERDTNVFVDAHALRSAFAPALESGRRVVTYCGGGIAAAVDALALTLIGEKNVAIYDGSLEEWASDADAPLATATPGPH